MSAALSAPAVRARGRTGERRGRTLDAWWLRYGVALLAGGATGLSWQPYGLWPLLFVGVPAFTLAVRGVARRRAFGLGYVFGLALLGISISWIHVLGIWVAVALIVFESLFFGVLGLALGLVSRFSLWPLAAACCWSLVEFAYSRIPFGGFGWVRLAYAAVDTPLAGFFSVLGVAGVSFLVALVAQLVAYVVWCIAGRRPARRRGLVAAVVTAAALILLGSGLGAASATSAAVDLAGQPSVTVGVVQGNVPGRGIEALGRARSVTNNHLAETIDLMAKARLGQVPEPDFILWPENSTDIDPLQDPVTRATVQSAADIAGRPILVGAVLAGPGADERQTAALWWDPQRGVVDSYAKRNLVPFGEWIPFRQELLPLIPLLERVGAQSVPGTEPGVLDVAVGDRKLKVGDIICFELAYDRTVYDTLVGGAQILVVQSNNATYGGTGQIEQQFAITRARAMEAQRDIAVATTNSVSGYIDRNGVVQTRTSEFTADSFVATMPLRSGLTPAITVAPWLELVLATAGLLACLVAVQLGVAGVLRSHRLGLHRTPERPRTPSSTGAPSHEGAPVDVRVRRKVVR